MQGEETKAEPEESHAGDTLLEEENDLNVLREYAVGRMMGHVGKVIASNKLYAGSDTRQLKVDPAAHIPKHFIHSFCFGCRCKMQGNKNRDKGTECNKEHMTFIVQASVILTI